MRSIADPGKDGPISHTAAAALVVGYCCIIALQLLPVPASLWMRHGHTARQRRSSDRPADGFLHNHCQNSRGFTKKIFSNLFFYCGLPFSRRKLLFPTMRTTIRAYSVGGGSASIRNKEGTHNFSKVPQSKFWCPGCARQPKNAGAATGESPKFCVL